MTPHDLLAAFDILVEAPDGIVRLRELILQLAVRGKLVPQDPNDEPACVLLERIAAEKARLAKEGKIPKPKPLPPVSKDEVPFEVPEGWVWTCTTALGIVNPRNEADETTVVSFAPMPLIPIDYREPVQPELRAWGDIRKGYTHFADGDIAVAKITPCFQNRKSCVMEGLPGGIGAGTTELHVLRPIPGTIHPKYLLIFYKSPEFIDAGVATMTGTAGQQRVPNAYFAFRSVPLPPLPEQHRIVAKVDALIALLARLETARSEREASHTALRDAVLATLRDAPDAEAVESAWTRVAERMDDLFTDPDDVGPLRQTILQLAVRGKLVPQDPNDEPVCMLLEHIAAEKARLAKEGKIMKAKPLPLVDEDEVPFEVPEGWIWCRFGTIADSRLGKMLDRSKNRGIPHPYLRNANVQWFRFELDDILEMRLKDHEVEEYSILPGDLLICEGGEPGRAAICNDSVGGMAFQKALHRARPFGGVVVEYLAYILRCDAVSGYLEQYFTGATIKHFTGQALASYVIPLPPTAEQHRIVAKVDALTALCDALEARLAAARKAQAAFATAAIHHLDA